VGKPRIGWENVLRRNISQILEKREWRRRAEDREEWWHVLRGTGAQKGL